MPLKKTSGAAIDFQLLDDGTATVTATPTDSIGELTTLPVGSSVATWSVADSTGVPSNAIVLTPVSSDPTGLSQTISVFLPTPPPVPLPTGLVVSVSVTLADGITSIKGSGNPIDIVPGTATQFVVVEQ